MANVSIEPIAARTLDGRNVSVTVADGTILSLHPLADPAPDSLPWIAPGLIDLQVNGCAGTDYNAWPLEAEAVKQSAIALRETGVTGFLPTIITNSPDRIAGLLDGFSSMLEQDHQLRELVIGHTAANGEQISGNDDYLAGSALPVIRGVENLVAAGLADINDAWDLASGAPARFLDLPERGQLAPGRRADLVLFQVSDGRFEIERVLVGNADRGPDHTSP